MSDQRLQDLQRFYALLDRLAEAVGGARTLGQCDGKLAWPKRGLYFFFEDGEQRTDTGTGDRVVRVGRTA